MTLTRNRLGERLVALFERTPGPNHVDRQRARQVAMREGAVDLQVLQGRLRATVVLDRRAPSTVTVRVPTWPDEAWDALLDELAAEVRHAGVLLSGELPPVVEQVLDRFDLDLVPARIDAETDDDSTPWRAIGATWLTWAHRCDNDPFSLLAPRGRDRANVLAELRARRAGGDATPVPVPRSGGVELLGQLDPSRLYTAVGLADIAVHPHPPDDPTALLRHLGTPPGVPDDRDLERLILRAADTAWTLAADEGSEEADDEVLLAELRARGMSTAAALATAVGWDLDRAREVLDRLYDDGTIMRGGSGDNARYRA